MGTIKQPGIAIIGAGLSGMCIAIKLKEAGFENITLYEKADAVGGTWRENTYPGVACDVPSHLYSFSFAPKADWTRTFSPGTEIQNYCEQIAEQHGLLQDTRFRHELTKSSFKNGEWHLEFANGEKTKAKYLISSIGGLHIPSFPDLEGQENFKGRSFHTAEWDHSYDLTGKRVAVIGTAASALQLIPKIVDKVASLDVYQRTPNWVAPRMEEAYSDRTKRYFSRFPFLAKLLRLWLYILYEMRVPLFRGSELYRKYAEGLAIKHLEAQVPCPELRAKLTPDYRIGCKRILASDEYFPALQKDNVQLITDGIEKVSSDAVVCRSGEERPADCIIYATGFRPFDMSGRMEIVAKDGLTLAGYMANGIRAHRAVAVPGFHNFFMMLGPNSGLGHNSVILIIEAQAKYITKAIEHAEKRGASSIEPNAAATDKFNKQLQIDLEGTVWSASCSSWYKDAQGHIYTLWPKGTVSFRRELSKFRPKEYNIE